ncbi:hypothetical protein [Flavivirga eckloniae]|uniref:Uncharacterized protein n=1 Tax=Flavivirga eckloniae TaxID=1803846 RepID=A0A2K9PR13_9FLAO|nr:hypothetical protein [Flavivirga eckloniae]AUP79510.1 hypothetical protein C1H87_12655 [Flavivirga eckloniae]
MSKEYKIIGYLRISKKSDTGFLNPIFQKGDGDERYRCTVKDSKISSFKELNNSFKDYVKEDEKIVKCNLTLREGDEIVHFFQKGEIFFQGNKSLVINQLIENFNSYIDELDEIKKYNLFNFIGFTAQADNERISLKKSEGIDILQKQLKKTDNLDFDLLSRETTSILKETKYSKVFRKYLGLKNIFSDYKLTVRIGNNLVNKKDLNAYLDSDSVVKSLNNRYSIEAYVFIKKQCRGTIEGIKDIPALNKEALSASPKIPCLYKNLHHRWELTEEEVPIIHMLDSVIDKNDYTSSPSVLNMIFEFKLFMNDNLEVNSKNEKPNTLDIEELDSIMSTIVKNNK